MMTFRTAPFSGSEGGDMVRCIALIHNSQVIVNQVGEAFRRIYSEAEVINIIDESLLRDIKTKGAIDHFGTRRVLRYALCAEDLGADAVLMTCSSLCEAAFAVRPIIGIPVFAINEPMSQQAVGLGKRIAVVGTLESVLDPTTRLLKHKAEESDRQVEIKRVLCAAAFEALIAGDPARHDDLILREIESVARDADAILFSQGSMSRLIPEARRRISVPILECIDSGVKQVKDYFARA
jgi:Asp/Glu/hydantoin racemase